jgi:hypothetical protein
MDPKWLCKGQAIRLKDEEVAVTGIHVFQSFPIYERISTTGNVVIPLASPMRSHHLRSSSDMCRQLSDWQQKSGNSFSGVYVFPRFQNLSKLRRI